MPTWLLITIIPRNDSDYTSCRELDFGQEEAHHPRDLWEAMSLETSGGFGAPCRRSPHVIHKPFSTLFFAIWLPITINCNPSLSASGSSPIRPSSAKRTHASDIMGKRTPNRKASNAVSPIVSCLTFLPNSQPHIKMATTVTKLSQTTTIDSLPIDLLEHISEILQAERLFATLSALDRTSKRFSRVCKKTLWQDVTFTKESQMKVVMMTKSKHLRELIQ
jgi:hypothetical protein